MYILIIQTKKKDQLFKLVLYNNPIKKATAKVNRMNKDMNKITVEGTTKFKADLIEVIYKNMTEPDINIHNNELQINMSHFVRSSHKYFQKKETLMSKKNLIDEYKRLVKENKHNVYQYNLI